MVKFDPNVIKCGQMWFIYQHSLPCGPHTSPISVAVLEKVLSWYRYDLIISPILLPSQVFFFTCWGTGNSQMMPTRENMEGEQPNQSHMSRTEAIATTDVCAGALSWSNPTPFIRFPGLFEMSLVLLSYFSKSWIVYPVWVLRYSQKETPELFSWEFSCNQLAHRESIACNWL